MSIPPPSHNVSKKRDRDEDDNQGHEREKKGKSVQAQMPAEPAADGLTRWNSRSLPPPEKIGKLKVLSAAMQQMQSLLLEIRAEKLLQEVEWKKCMDAGPARDVKKSIKTHIRIGALKAQDAALFKQYSAHQAALHLVLTSPGDKAEQMSGIRTAVCQYLKHQVSSATHQFQQNRLSWSVGPGKCAPISMEYIHRRRAKASPADIVRHLNAPSAQGRLQMTQTVYEASHSRLTTMFEAEKKWPQKDMLYKASLKRDLPTSAIRLLDRPFAALNDTLTSDRSDPAAVAKKTLRLFHNMPGKPDFSLEGLMMIWPAGAQAMPELRPFTKLATVSAIVGASGSSSSSSSSASMAQADTNAAAGAVQDPPVPQPIIRADLEAYGVQCAFFGHCFLRRPAEPYLYITMQTLPSGGHVIVLDLSAEHAGIFDANMGFIPLRPNASFRDFVWLLSLFFIAYDAGEVQVFTLQ